MSDIAAEPAPEAASTADPAALAPASDSLPGMRVPLALFGVCLAAQLYLVFFKSFNWDEFLHFGQIYQLRAGTLVQPLQVLHTRILWWAPHVSSDLLVQMQSARLFIWAVQLLTLLAIFGIARQFTSAANSFFAAFAYLTAGYVFLHGFAIRADPLVTATLMSALWMLAARPLNLARALGAGALVGMAGMITMKAVFYAPCFAGLIWLRYREAADKRQFLTIAVLMPIAAAISFAAIYLYHTADIVEVPKPLPRTSSVELYSRWITVQLPFAGYIGREILLAPLFFLLIVLAPSAWRKAGLDRHEQLALLGFLTPLIVLLFYRNTFPYFFVFILAPIAVAVAPAFGLLQSRFGRPFIALLLTGAPLALAVLEPGDVIMRQRAMIDYVHAEFPTKTGYLDYSGMIADYPRVLKYLTSGNGMRYYREVGEPIIAREIDRGNVPFIIANRDMILAALQGRPFPETFLPADMEALNGNYVRQWGALWREGKQIPAGQAPYAFEIRRGGEFVLARGPIEIDGTQLAKGMKIRLEKGRHSVAGGRAAASTLWRGEKLPSPPPRIEADELFTNF